MSLSAAKLLARNWRSGELSILLAAVVLAVALVVAMSGLMSRFEQMLTGQSSQLLGADLLVQGREPLAQGWRERATDMGLEIAQTVEFPSMIFGHGDAMSLASVKAVSDNYPLRGQLQIADRPYGSPEDIAHGPRPGEMWFESRLLGLLGVEVGDTVFVGEAGFVVGKVLRTEPDRGGSLFSLGPRAMMNIVDLAATDVLRPGSRASYSSLFAGTGAQIKQLKTALNREQLIAQRVIDANAGPSAVARAMNTARRYLLLAAGLGVMLAGTALVLAARRFVRRHEQDVAILKSLGATALVIRKAYGLMLLYVAAIGIVIGSVLGTALQTALIWRLRPEAAFSLSLTPLLLGTLTALITLIAFAWPPIYRLGRANPLRVLRRDIDEQNRREYWDIAFGVLGLVFLMWYYSRDLAMALAVLAGVAIVVLLTALCTVVLLKGLRIIGMQAGSVWRLALSGLLRHRAANVLQVVVFALCFMLIFVLVLLRSTLLGDWRAQVPMGAPNHFLVNVHSQQVPEVKQQLSDLGLRGEGWYPMSRGRIVAINDQALPGRDIAGDDRRARQRESNLSISRHIPAENTLIAGQWWGESPYENPVSLERGYAKDLGLSVGDTVTFQVGTQSLSATVASIRSLRWESLRPNFFVLFPPEALKDYPATWMTSFYLPPTQKSALNTLVKAFPTVSIIEVDAIIRQVQTLLAHITRVIEVIVYLMLAAGALVMLAAVRASVDVRRHESAVLRALGAPSRLLLGAQALEFAILGAVAAVLAIAGAECTAWLLHGQLNLNYQPSLSQWPLALSVVMCVVTALGLASCYKAVRVSPVVVLREG